jgi:hypothetical protein
MREMSKMNVLKDERAVSGLLMYPSPIAQTESHKDQQLVIGKMTQLYKK